LYFEKKTRAKRKAPAMPSRNAQRQAQNPVHMPFILPNKKQKKSSDAAGHSSSQACSQSSAEL
jgi:hypothetical protein